MSKYFPGKTNDEIAAATSEDLQTIIDLTCAEQGIPVYLDEVLPPKPPVQHDLELYEVGDWMFGSRADAEKVAALAMSFLRFNRDWRYDSSQVAKQADPDFAIEIKTRRFFSPKEWRDSSHLIKAYEAAVKATEEQRKVFESFDKQREAVRVEVYLEWTEARKHTAERERIYRLYQKYVGLAKGDREIAIRFLQQAEKLTDEYIDELKLRDAADVIVDAAKPPEPDIPF